MKSVCLDEDLIERACFKIRAVAWRTQSFPSTLLSELKLNLQQLSSSIADLRHLSRVSFAQMSPLRDHVAHPRTRRAAAMKNF